MKNVLTPDQIQALKLQSMASQAGVDIVNVVDEKNAQANNGYHYVRVDGLPSGNIFYNNYINVRGLIGDDVFLIGRIDADNADVIIGELLNRVLDGKVLQGEILVADEMYILLYLRMISYEGIPLPSVLYDCPHCKSSVSTGLINYSDVKYIVPDIENIIDSYKANNNKAPEYNVDGVVFTVDVKRRKHIRRALSFIEQSYTSIGRFIDPHIETLTHVLSNVKIEGCDDLSQSIELVRSLPAKTFNKILKIIADNSLTCTLSVGAKCTECGNHVDIRRYPFRKELYFTEG